MDCLVCIATVAIVNRNMLCHVFCRNAMIAFISTCGNVPAYSFMYKTEHAPAARVFSDAVRVWESIGTIAASESVTDVARRLCRFDEAAATYETITSDAAPEPVDPESVGLAPRSSHD
jgi:hypothetical protein